MHLRLLVLIILISTGLHAQWPYMTAIPNGDNKKAVTTEQVGMTDVTIAYHRPGVKGREGKIWGALIPPGFNRQGFGTDKPAPWRAGANENTIIECSKDITVEGKSLQKGRYALFIAYDSNECTVIFSKKTDAWGSFFYDEHDDALRVKVHPFPLEKSIERLRYEFTDQTDSSAVIRLEWERLAIPFRIEVDYMLQQFEAIDGELKNPRGFTFESLTKGAAWCLENNYKMENGLAWINMATDSVNGFGGNSSFTSLSTKARLLDKLGRKEESMAVMRSAMAFGTMNDLHLYGKQLVTLKKQKEALDVFRLNYKNNPGSFITNVGMVRGLSANGNYEEAQKFAQRAFLLAPDDSYKKLLQTMIDKLKNRQDIN